MTSDAINLVESIVEHLRALGYKAELGHDFPYSTAYVIAGRDGRSIIVIFSRENATISFPVIGTSWGTYSIEFADPNALAKIEDRLIHYHCIYP